MVMLVGRVHVSVPLRGLFVTEARLGGCEAALSGSELKMAVWRHGGIELLLLMLHL